MVEVIHVDVVREEPIWVVHLVVDAVGLNGWKLVRIHQQGPVANEESMVADACHQLKLTCVLSFLLGLQNLYPMASFSYGDHEDLPAGSVHCEHTVFHLTRSHLIVVDLISVTNNRSVLEADVFPCDVRKQACRSVENLKQEMLAFKIRPIHLARYVGGQDESEGRISRTNHSSSKIIPATRHGRPEMGQGASERVEYPGGVWGLPFRQDDGSAGCGGDEVVAAEERQPLAEEAAGGEVDEEAGVAAAFVGLELIDHDPSIGTKLWLLRAALGVGSGGAPVAADGAEVHVVIQIVAGQQEVGDAVDQVRRKRGPIFHFCF
ncbi:hypothetical protein QOZ80_1BG0096990 [Eleusine coracana subsp. coracana]|nr:hypothetical protein QOZ80_1BG0096990 [Eleusine coracana subsp. coracana]